MAKFNEIESAVVSLNDKVKVLTDSMQTLINVVNSNSKSQSDLADKTNKVKKASTDIDAVEKERLKLLDQLKKANSDRIQKNEEIKIQLQKQKKVNKELAKEKLGLISVYEKESKRLNDLRKRYKDLALTNKGNSKEAKNLKKEITNLDKKLKDVDSTVGQNQRNVGNYGDAFRALPGPIGGVINSVKMLAKVIFATPLGWLIGLVAAAGAALKTFFVNSEEGQDRWNKITAKGKVILGNFKDGLAEAGKGLLDFGKRIKESEGGIKGWAKSVGENARKAWSKFKQDVSDKGVWQTVKDNASDALDTVQEKFKAIADENKREIAIAEQLAELENQLNKKERKNLVETAKLRRDIAELRAQAADKENTTALQRIHLIDEAIAKQNEILELEEDTLSKRVFIAKEEAKLSGSTREDLQAIAELEAQLINLQTTNAERRRRFAAEQQTAIREQKAEIDSFIKSLEAENDAFTESIITNNDDVTKAVIANDKEQLASAKKLIDFRKQAEEDLKNQSIAGINTLFDLRSSLRDSDIEGLEMQKEAEIAIAEEKGQSTTGIEEKFAKKESELRKKQAIQDKLQALFNAGITIAEGILKYSSNPLTAPLVPAFIALGAIQLGAIAATPIPKFRTGVKDFEGGMAYIHSNEIVDTKDGMFAAPLGETLAFIPKGSDVLTAQESAPILKESKESGLELRELKAINKQLSKNNTGYSRPAMTPEGTEYWAKQKGIRKTYLDRRIR
jgi:DNA repair exonuclease SbcCD ATPase subunit